MADFEQKSGTGVLFSNNKTRDTHPDWKGNITTPDGKKWDISSWIKQGKKGEFLSLSIQEPYQRAEQAPIETVEVEEVKVDDLAF